MAKVEIYTRGGCGYCTSARALLARKGVAFVEYSADVEPERRQEMYQRSSGTTFPQIFINDRSIGGCDDLHELERAGRLDALLSHAADGAPAR